MKWSLILATLRMALPFITMAQVMLKNFDANDEGIDDKIADGVKKGIDAIIGALGAETPDTPGQAKGLVAITAFGNAVVARLTAIAGTTPMTDELKAEARAKFASLSDPAQVYQPRRGDDRAALDDAKAKAQALLTQIEGS